MSNLMILGDAPLTMSSREIAELTGKEHPNVMRDIRGMLEELGEDVLRFEDIYSDAYGRCQPCFNLPKDLTITLVAGYNTKVRHAIVTRWQELEAQQTPAFAIPKSLPEALRLAADLSEQNERLAIERDEAVRTKAQIGSKREATAMATAAAAKREADQLRHELGRNQQHATVVAVEKATGRNFPKNAYVALRRATKEYGLAAVEVVDARYGSVKAWPAIAWREAYAVELADLFPGAEAA
jgi:phage regulator Rha-like protein